MEHHELKRILLKPDASPQDLIKVGQLAIEEFPEASSALDMLIVSACESQAFTSWGADVNDQDSFMVAPLPDGGVKLLVKNNSCFQRALAYATALYIRKDVNMVIEVTTHKSGMFGLYEADIKVKPNASSPENDVHNV